MRVEQLAKAADVPLVWRAFLLGPIFGAQGWNDSPFNLYPAKGAYMWRDLERICAAEGIPLKRPSRFPRSGLTAARVACRFADRSEEHTSELQSLMRISYAVFCLKQNTK